jgi:pimeloyl-ACP methyl ester carboxylesterase
VAAARVPVLLLAGPLSPGGFAATGGTALENPDRTQVLGTLPANRVVVMQGKHCLHCDQPERWVEEVHAFAVQTLPA